MKKFVWALLFLILFSSTAYAAPQFGIGLRVGHNFYQDGTLDIEGTGVSVDYSNKSAWVYGINGTFKPTENFSLELALDRISKSQCDFKLSGVTFNSGDITQTPLTLTARFHWPIGIFSPYIGAGLGYYWNSFDKSGVGGAIWWLPTTTVDLENSFGYHVNAGTEIFLDEARHLALNMDFKYVWTKAEISATNAGATIKGDMNLDSFVAGLGIKYYF